MNKSEFLQQCSLDYDKWSKSQEGQSDAYEFERSLDELMTLIGHRFMQMSVGKVPSNHRKKNDSYTFRTH